MSIYDEDIMIFNVFLAKLYGYEGVMTPYMYALGKRDKITIKLIQTLKSYRMNINSRIKIQSGRFIVPYIRKLQTNFGIKQ